MVNCRLRVVFFCLMAVGLALAGSVRGSRASEALPLDHHELVRQLGDADFGVRRRAARRLRQLGLVARPALLDGLEQPDLEIRLRARQILLQIQQTDFDSQVTAFLDGDQSVPFEFAGWDAYERLVGDDRSTRLMFVQMMRDEPALLDALERDDEQVEQMYLDRLQQLQNDAFAAIQGNGRLSPSGISALLLVGATKANQSPVANSRMYSLLSYPTTKDSIRNGPQSKMLMRLLKSWILAASDDSRTYRSLSLALTYDMAETGLELARNRLKSTKSTKLVLQYAAVTVGRFGTEQDLILLEPHLNNDQLCTTFPIRDEVINTQVRDVVLAMLIHLARQSHADYGFEHLQVDDRTLFALHKLGFASDQKRTAAINRWLDQH